MKKLMFSSLLFSLLFCMNFSSQELKQNRSLTVEQWREDLQFLVTQIKSTHPKPFFKTSEYTFWQAIKSLYKKIPEISENEIITELLRITSLLEDGHTRLLGKNLTRLWFPVRVYEFENGFFITATSTDYVDAIGAKIVKIGKYTVDEAFKKIKSITPHDNQYSLSYGAPGYLMMSSVLSGFNIIDNPALLNLSIEKGERIMELNIKANEFESDDDFMWYWLLDGVPSNEFVRFIDLEKEKSPMTYRNREQFYWFEYLEKSNTVYMCFNLYLDSE